MDSKVSQTFPLPVSPMEHLILVKDRDDYPMTLWVYLEFLGKFPNREFLEFTILEGLKGHERFQAHISGPLNKKTSDLFWVDASSEKPYIDWGKKGDPLVFPKSHRINLYSELGTRFFIRESKEKTYIYIQVHHACCDGLGIFLFLDNIHRRIFSLLSQDKSIPSYQMSNLSQKRDPSPHHIEGGRFKRFWISFKNFSDGLNYTFKSIQPLAHPPFLEVGTFEAENKYPSFKSFTFNPLETEDLIIFAKKQGASLHDLMITDLFLALAKWNESYEITKKNVNLRILIPVDLRFRTQTDPTLKNNLTFFEITQTSKALQSPQKLLQNIILETEKIRRSEPRAFLFQKFIKILGKINGLMYSAFNWDKHIYATSLLSFIPLDNFLSPAKMTQQGYSIKLDDQLLVLEKIVGMTPYQRSTPAVFNALTYRGQLTINVHYDPKIFSSIHGEALLNCFINQIKNNK